MKILGNVDAFKKPKLVDKDNIVRPWLNDESVIHPDSILRNISKIWTAETWELFLVETVERSGSYTREELITPYAYRMAIEELMESVWEWTHTPEDDDLCNLIRRFIRDHLTPRQQHIIRLTFWDGCSERMAAEVLGITRSTVAAQKRRSFKKLKGLLETRVSIFPRSERVTQKNRSHERSRDAQIREVYKEEISNLYGKFGGG